MTREEFNLSATKLKKWAKSAGCGWMVKVKASDTAESQNHNHIQHISATFLHLRSKEQHLVSCGCLRMRQGSKSAEVASVACDVPSHGFFQLYPMTNCLRT